MSGTPPTDPCNQPALTTDQFRAMFPAFADATQYPDTTIQSWLNLAPVDPCLWGEWYNLGQGLWTAHELAKFATPEAVANAGGISGPVQSKSVGPVSVSYDTTTGAEDGAGQYNTTIYGRQFWAYARIIGTGPYQIGAAVIPPYGVGPNQAWVGPPPLPGWFG